MKSFLKRLFPPESASRWVITGFYYSPLSFLVIFFKSLIATRRLTGQYTPIKVRVGKGQKIRVIRSPESSIFIDGVLFVNSWGGSRLPSSITCLPGSSLKIYGDFEIGPNVHILVSSGASIVIGGKLNSSGSGITCDCRIMSEKSITIGIDCIIAWDVFISDSDWHNINCSERCMPVVIGDNVWISHGVSVLKGVNLPSGCIVGAKSLVRKNTYHENAFISGVPAVVKKTDVRWSR